MSELAQRVEAALAAASATLLSAHAHLSRAAAARLASRLPPARTVALYCHEQDLSPVDSSWIRMQALARMGALSLSPASTAPAGAPLTERIRCAIREWLRVQFAPHGDPALQELLEFEYAYARAVILKIHVRNAIRFAAAVRPDFSGPAAVALYIDRLRVPGDSSGAVYAMAVAQLAAVRFAAMLAPTRAGAAPANGVRARAAEWVPPVLDADAGLASSGETAAATPALGARRARRSARAAPQPRGRAERYHKNR